MIGNVGNREAYNRGMWEIGRIMIGDVGNRGAYDRGWGNREAYDRECGK